MKILRMCTDELKRRLPIDFKGVSSIHYVIRSCMKGKKLIDIMRRCW